MKRGAIWRVTVIVGWEGEEAVTDLVEALFGKPASAYVDFETGKVTVTVYSRARPGRWDEQRARLREGLHRIRRCGLRIGVGRILLGRLRRENWAESWKRHFHPIDIGGALLIKPSWSKLRPKPGQKQIVLDPGLSFGTGHHATTQFCLRELVRCRKSGALRSFLDVGTGSGILAIAAAKLGYKPVRGFDLDPEAVRVARANVRLNRMTGLVTISQRDVRRMPGHRADRYDVVCVNLASDLLVEHGRRIAGFLRPGAVLVLAGILRKEFGKVQKAFRVMGLCLQQGSGKGEWYSGTFRREA